ncbi:hypothetical protein EXIGLDRAFT_831075 [Exidia glandulosa HHB12029]|uniref:F-box domain-containing protein n=1 Tax=Exidia glandulosa HHB12029 TaxID=1314781 RepID=A0A165MZV2_EXIGL|nr:hypothetical protein EXIGLDRAFT_831075 [Exidia glandulosa HHB12029]
MMDIPPELYTLIFDHLTLQQLIRSSHVCTGWRYMARDHKTFWGEAVVVEFGLVPLTPTSSAVNLFLARISEAKGPVSVSVLIFTLSPVVHQVILPTLSRHLHRISCLRVAMPWTCGNVLLSVLQQPAPLLKTFVLNSLRAAEAWQPLCLPVDWHKNYAPPPIQALARVETFKIDCPSFYGNMPLRPIISLFPSLRHLEVGQTLQMGEGPLLVHDFDDGPLPTVQDGGMLSLSVFEPTSSALRALDAGNIPTVDVTMLEFREDVVKEVLGSGVQVQCRLNCSQATISTSARSANPQHTRRSATFSIDRALHAAERCFSSVSRFGTLVALSVHRDAWRRLCALDANLPALELIHTVIEYPLPAGATDAKRLRCDNLRTLVLQSRIRTALTYRAFDTFVTASIAIRDWAALSVVLDGVTIFGPYPPVMQIAPTQVRTWDEAKSDVSSPWLLEMMRQW